MEGARVGALAGFQFLFVVLSKKRTEAGLLREAAIWTQQCLCCFLGCSTCSWERASGGSTFQGEAKKKLPRLNSSMGPQARGQPADACLGRRDLALDRAGVR